MLADASRLEQSSERRAIVAGAVFVFLATLVNGVIFVSAMTGADTRDQALAELNASATPPQRIGFAVQPWFGTAPVSPYFTMPRPAAGSK